MKLVYVSGPISNGGQDDYTIQEDNVRAAIPVAQHLLDAGYAVLLPHLTYYWDVALLDVGSPTNSHNDWLRNDKELLARCDAVLRLPGESQGADKEVRWAGKEGIPVFRSVEQLFECLPPR